MFGKNKIAGSPSKLLPPSDGGENPWDASNIAKICTAEKLNVRILHIEKLYRDGAFAPDKEHKFSEITVVGTGVIPDFPQHVHVELTFQKEMQDYGVMVLTYQYNMSHQYRSVNMPLVQIVLRDESGGFAASMYEAMRDALLSGQDGIEMRCWMNFAPGWEQRESTVYGKITGSQVWSNLHAANIPPWSMPIAFGNLQDYPDATRLRAAPEKK